MQVQKITSSNNEYNTLATTDSSEIVVFTSAGNFNVYQAKEGDELLAHKVSYYRKNDSQAKESGQDNRVVIEFENDEMKEVSAFKLYQDYLIVTYWDSDRGKVLMYTNYNIGSSKCIEFLNKDNLNEVVAKYYFDAKSLVKSNTDMDVDENPLTKENIDKTYRNYLYSIVSIEIVSYHPDFLYLICGADNGYLYSFCFDLYKLDKKAKDMRTDPTSVTNSDSYEILFNMRSTSLGNSPVYLFSMASTIPSQVSNSALTSI